MKKKKNNNRNINDEIKNRKHSFKVILVITIICIIINILECVLKRQIDIINTINFVILIIAIIIDISVLIYLRKLEKREIQKNKENYKIINCSYICNIYIISF